MSIDPRIKQGEFCRVIIQNGDEEYGFDLDYLLAFGIFADGRIGGHPEIDGSDKYMAIAIQSSKGERQTNESMEDLLLRMLNVVVQAYASRGYSLQDMTKLVQNNLLLAMSRYIGETRGISPQQSAEVLMKELRMR